MSEPGGDSAEHIGGILQLGCQLSSPRPPLPTGQLFKIGEETTSTAFLDLLQMRRAAGPPVSRALSRRDQDQETRRHRDAWRGARLPTASPLPTHGRCA
jgi:hypothetical protein